MMAKPKKKPKRLSRVVEQTEKIPLRTIPNIKHKPETDEGEWGDDGLTLRQRAFVEAVIGPAGGNATKAAEMAGYAAENREVLKTTASRLLTFANVQKAIAVAAAKRRLSPEWVKNRLADLANADMANFLTVDEQGVAQLDFQKAINLGAMGQIKEYDAERGKIKLHDPSSALTTLLKLFGLLVDRHDHTSGGKPIKAYADINDGDIPTGN